MKRFLALALVLILALSLTACKFSIGNNSDPTGSSDPTSTPESTTSNPSGELTLAALKKAAEDAGYTKFQGMSSTTNQDETLPKPVEGFTIGIKEDSGSTGYNISVNEFASKEEAAEYAGYIVKEGHYGNAHLSGKFTAVFITDIAKNAESALMDAFKAAGWTEDTIPEYTYTPPAAEHSEGLQALIQAVRDLGFETRDEFIPDFSATIEPQDGFIATFYTSKGMSDIQFFEFKDNAEALAYKAENDDPDATFPKEHIVVGKFAAEVKSLSKESGAECKKFVEDVFSKAGVN